MICNNYSTCSLVLFFTFFISLQFSVVYSNAQINTKGTGAIFLSKEKYDALPKANFYILKMERNNKTATTKILVQ